MLSSIATVQFDVNTGSNSNWLVKPQGHRVVEGREEVKNRGQGVEKWGEKCLI